MKWHFCTCLRACCRGGQWGSELQQFDWADAFYLDDQLTDDERMIRDTARAYAVDKLAPRVIEAFNDEITDPA
ncbi:hypothetical protein DFR49_3881, partial [Hephaestia caeni]